MHRYLETRRQRRGPIVRTLILLVCAVLALGLAQHGVASAAEAPAAPRHTVVTATDTHGGTRLTHDTAAPGDVASPTHAACDVCPSDPARSVASTCTSAVQLMPAGMAPAPAVLPGLVPPCPQHLVVSGTRAHAVSPAPMDLGVCRT